MAVIFDKIFGSRRIPPQYAAQRELLLARQARRGIFFVPLSPRYTISNAYSIRKRPLVECSTSSSASKGLSC
jgi:hypothetical protein